MLLHTVWILCYYRIQFVIVISKQPVILILVTAIRLIENNIDAMAVGSAPDTLCCPDKFEMTLYRRQAE